MFRQHLLPKRRYAPLAQLAEQLTLNQRVVGSIPTRCNSLPRDSASAPATFAVTALLFRPKISTRPL